METPKPLKTLLYAGLSFSCTIGLAGQDSKLTSKQVPSAVRSAASKQFPDARISHWSKETEDGKTTYEASVADTAGKRDAVFAENGGLVAIEQEIAFSELPAPVKSAATADYKQEQIGSVEKISHAGIIEYEISLKNAAKKELTFSPEGRLLKKE